jgi:F0F1-type ATP synthase delta subunit
LSDEKKSEIHQKLVRRFGQDISTFYIEKPNLTGIIAQGDGKEINLSLEGKINKLKQALAKEE